MVGRKGGAATAMGLAACLWVGAAWGGQAMNVRENPPADFYVSPAGDDANPGTLEKPFATVARAQQAVRALRKKEPNRGVTVLIRGGTYVLAEPLLFGPEDSGTADAPVFYAAYPGERPLLSGGRRIGGWKQGPGGVWTADLPEVKAGKWTFRELFVNGARRFRARTPNEGFFRVVAAGADNRTAFTFKEGDLKAYANPAEVEVVFLHDWSISRVPVAAVDEATRTVRLAAPIGAAGQGFFAITGFEPHPRYFVENARELLDAPGEWHLDRQAGVLSYLPMPGEAMSGTEVVAPVVEQLVVVQGDGPAGRLVEGLRFVGLSFAHCAFQPPAKGYAGIQAGFHEDRDGPAASPRRDRGRMPAAVRFEGARRCAFEDGRIAQVGGTGISLEGFCSDNRVVGNAIDDCGGNGVMVGTTDRRDAKGLARNNLVADNAIRRCGRLYFGCVAVWAGLTEGTVVEHNEISRHPYTGVSVGWQWNPEPTPCRGNLVRQNHIHHVMQVLSDGGGIYTLGRQPGTVLGGNHIHDVPPNAGRAQSNGLFIDEGSSSILIEGNTIHGIARSPIRFHKASENTIRKNVLAVARGTPPYTFNACAASDMTFDENAVVAAEGFVPPAETVERAGLTPPYRDRLLGPEGR